ncbi:MAG: RNA-guided pseudouridylation complex pseudouridine synthase subunit Cbf5 [Halobacteriaceae archaeon]
MTLRDPPGERSPADRLAFGVVNLDKPAGPSAHQVAAWLRDLAGVERAAHAGTLDPKVTGCLPVLLGTATRAAMALDGATKEYVAVLELHADPPADLAGVLAEFEGPIHQKPPRRSAVVRRLRTREVYALDAVDRDGRQVLLRVRCAPGTYVRKLCHDLGLALGTGAHMGDLRRTATGHFDDTDLVSLHDVADGLARARETGEDDWLREAVQPAERALAALPAVTVARSAAREVANGAPVYAPGVLDVGGAGGGPPPEPGGSAVCLGRLVGDPDAEEGTVVDLERVLV